MSQVSPERNEQMYGSDVDPTSTYAGGSRAEAFSAAAKGLGELKEYVSYYISAKADGIKVSIRNLALYAVLGIAGGIIGIGLLVTSAVLLLSGIAGALGALFGGRDWLGNLLVGLLVLGGAGVGVMIFMKKLTKTSRQQTVDKYESRQRQQRAQYGHDVKERGANSGNGNTVSSGSGSAAAGYSTNG